MGDTERERWMRGERVPPDVAKELLARERLDARSVANAERRADALSERVATLREVMRAFNPQTRQLSEVRFAELFPEAYR